MSFPVDLAQRLRSHGLKLTPQRELVFRLIYGNTSHPTADTLFAAAREQMPMISLKTVYQVLNDLAALGEIQVLDLGTGSVRFDPNTSEHHHAVCGSCGSILDVAVSALPSLQAIVDAPSSVSGFRVDEVDVTFRGTCGSCAAAA